MLLTLVLTITVLSAIRLFTALAWRATLNTYMGAQEVGYVAVSGAFWALAGLFVLWSFWRGGRWVRWIFLAAAATYAVWAWGDRMVVQYGPRANWPFSLIVTILLVGFVAAVVLDPRNQFYFGKESHERKPQEHTTA